MTFPDGYEDHLMVRHWEIRCGGRGTLWLEVGLGKGPGHWPGDSERRLDGIWVPDAPSRGIIEWALGDDRFPEDVDGTRVELIEAKRHLNVDVIGQVLAGVDMFARSYPRTSVIDRCVVVGGELDPVLNQVCGGWGIAVCAYELG